MKNNSTIHFRIGFAVIALIAIFTLLNTYKDSFYTLYAPITNGDAAGGTVFYDKWRFTPDTYLVIDNQLEKDTCDILSWEGQLVEQLPGIFCHFFSDGSLLLTNGALTLYSKDKHLLWKKKMHVHHDVFVDEEAKTIFVVGGEISQEKGKRRTRQDQILGFNLKGEEIFRWRFSDHKKELEQLIGESIDSYDVDKTPYIQFTHWNSVQNIPANALEDQYPEWHRGNILVNCYEKKLMFLIDQATGNIVWHHRFKGIKKAHQTRLLPDGSITYFANLPEQKISETDMFSAIESLSPITHEVLTSATTEQPSAFFSPYWGSVEMLDKNKVLVTNSLSGSVFVFDTENKRILWQWNSALESANKRKPIYRATVFPKKAVEQSQFINNG